MKFLLEWPPFRETKNPVKQFLTQVLHERLSAEQWSWLEAVCATIQSGAGSNAITASYAAASRRLGKRALQLTLSEQAGLAESFRLMQMNRWGADEAGRAVILLSLVERPRDEFVEIVRQCYEFGDSREQQSWLRSLSLLPESELFLDTAIDSCRTNIVPLFEAIACENPYPSRYFLELNFNQMVLKCLFNRIALSRVIGLESRYNPELTRMADHYVKELNAAGRDVPKDIGLLIGSQA